MVLLYLRKDSICHPSRDQGEDAPAKLKTGDEESHSLA
jgi:hypothetical protein